MTAGKDRQKVPHWMGLPVKAAAGSSPADTSEILLKTATNMYLAGKNIGENLAVSKEVAILAVPRRRRFFESKTDIRFTADKAGFFFGRFLFGEVDVLADFQKSLASFVIYIQQIFVSIMPRRDKNLTISDCVLRPLQRPRRERPHLLPPASRRRSCWTSSAMAIPAHLLPTTSSTVAP